METRNTKAINPSISDKKKGDKDERFNAYPLMKFYENLAYSDSLKQYETVIERLSAKVKQLKEENTEYRQRASYLRQLEQRLNEEIVKSSNAGKEA